jgi:CheY-like chemotaxis protein
MSEPLRVLVVDDSVQIRALLAHALRLRGFTPVEADGGAAALRLVMTHAFAIAGLLPWVLHVMRRSFVALVLFTALMRSFAVASAGPSYAAIAPTPS